MKITVSKSAIKGTITAPTSKSALQRHIAAAMLANGKSTIQYESMCEDAEAVLGIARSLGAKVIQIGNKIEINGGINNPLQNLYIGESGLGLRMITPILAATGYSFEISGRGSLLKRPVDFVVNTLKSAGVETESTNNSLPLKLKGPIREERIQIDGSLGSQLLTGFLMAAPLLKREVLIEVKDLKSISYIDLTISILNNYGITIRNENYQKFTIPENQSYHHFDAFAEGDWSGAAFVLVAAAIAGEIKLLGIDNQSVQGDRSIVEVLRMCGSLVEQSDNEIIVKKNQLNAFEFDATDAPDLFPPLVALAINCKGQSKIKGVGRLKHKESDRAQTLKNEFEKLGATITFENDYMLVEGNKLSGAIVHSHNDHRIAMALAVAALTIDNQVIIEDSEAVAKSWPDFFEKFARLGAKLS